MGRFDHWGDNFGDLGLFSSITQVMVGMVRGHVPHKLVGTGKVIYTPLGGGKRLICPFKLVVARGYVLLIWWWKSQLNSVWPQVQIP